MFNSIDSYNMHDPLARMRLEDIQPLSSRAHALLVRNKTRPLLKVGFINVVGAIEMLAGMEYHHGNLVRSCAALATGEAKDEAAPYHEAVAYVNRMGQFYYFAISDFVAKAVDDPGAVIPSIKNFVVFRMKHAGHRSIDAPKPSDTEGLQWSHARSLSWSVGGRMMMPRPGMTAVKFPPNGPISDQALQIFRRELWKTTYITFQIIDSAAGSHKNLTIETDHDAIASEAYALIQAVIMADARAPPKKMRSHSDPI